MFFLWPRPSTPRLLRRMSRTLMVLRKNLTGFDQVLLLSALCKQVHDEVQAQSKSLTSSSFAATRWTGVCFIALIESIRHHSVGPCLQLGDPSERDDPSLCIGCSPRQLMFLARGSQNLSMNHFVTGGIHGWIRRGS